MRIQLTLSPEQAIDDNSIRTAISKNSNIHKENIYSYRLIKKSVDARQRQLKVLLTLEVFSSAQEASLPPYELPKFSDVSRSKHSVIIVGAGPAGLFAALRLIELGIKPIVIEQGKEVSERKKDIAKINRNEGLDERSNYCFGEGGAGTFSDGKLFSRSKKRGNMQRVMELFHYFGAKEEVLYETHAHIGSDKLPTIIKKMRETIINYGGEVRFGVRVDDVIISDDTQKIVGVKTDLAGEIYADAVLLAIGHSSHNTYKMLYDRGVRVEQKGIAVGVRVEHKQSLINRLMYHTEYPPQGIGNAAYQLLTQVDGRGVYSFCMCPGGHIVPASSSRDGCVVNGMSASHRNSPFANSAIVVEIRPEDIRQLVPKDVPDNLSVLYFQHYIEQLALEHGGLNQEAPAQRLKDFVEGRESFDLPNSTYLPGLCKSRLDEWLPKFISKRLRQGFIDFDKKYKGFLTNDAVIIGVESRTSSAIRILRDNESRESVNIENLYPCGEGAGYAGGITSSALDGILSAEKCAAKLLRSKLIDSE